jgi:hypothetical protein
MLEKLPMFVLSFIFFTFFNIIHVIHPTDAEIRVKLDIRYRFRMLKCRMDYKQLPSTFNCLLGQILAELWPSLPHIAAQTGMTFVNHQNWRGFQTSEMTL